MTPMAVIYKMLLHLDPHVNHHPGPEHFGYVLRALVADTPEKAIELGRQCMWTEHHRTRGPHEHNDPPGYQSREAL